MPVRVDQAPDSISASNSSNARVDQAPLSTSATNTSNTRARQDALVVGVSNPSHIRARQVPLVISAPINHTTINQMPLDISGSSSSHARVDQSPLIVSVPVPPPPPAMCTTPIYILAANVDNRLEETDPPIFWSQQLEIYSALIEAENDLLLLIGRPTQVVNQTIVLTPNSVWQTLPRGIFTLTDMVGPNGPLHKVTLFGMDYEQGPGVTSAWENDTGPYPKRWGPIGFNMFFVHPAPAQAVTVNITAIQYPTTNPWPYTGMEFAPFHDEFFVALEEYAACYARLKETSLEAQEGFALYAEYLSLAQRLTVIEDRRDPIIFSTSFGARSGVIAIKKR